MKKKIIVISASVLVLTVLGLMFWFWILSPRVEIDKYIKEHADNTNIQIVATNFSNYDTALSGETIEITNGHIKVSIPSRYKKDDSVTITTTDVYRYDGEKTKECVMLLDVYDWGEDMNLAKNLDSSNYLDVNAKIGAEQLKQGFDSLTGVTPDSAYNTLKCMYTLSENDYDFWNLNKQIAYGITAILKSTIMSAFDDTVYIYEKEDICGFVSYTERTEEQMNDPTTEATNLTKYSVKLEIFDRDDLNTSTTILMYSNDLNEAFAIMNSVETV